VLSLVARGVAHTVLPASAVRMWSYDRPLHHAAIVAPAMRNRVVLGIPKARPATRPARFAADLLRRLALAQYGAG